MFRPLVPAVAALAVSAIASATPAASPQVPAPGPRPLFVERADDPVPLTAAGQPDFASLARFARRSVVSITATSADEELEVDKPSAREFFERFYGGTEPPTKGMASGFVIREDGLILTNEHVVKDASGLAVSLGEEDGRTYPAIVVGRDDLSDLALIKIDAGRPLPALPLGDSDTLTVGDWVTVIGNPFGLSHSVTVGVISFIGRHDVNPSGRPGYYDFIQTDASINPGNSGGPIIDKSGRVVAISAAVNASGQGIGFAIPINMAKDVLPALFQHGAVKRSYLGVSIQDLTPDLAESFGVEHGVVVTEVAPDGPAKGAGFEVGDIITSFDGAAIEHAYRLRWLASSAGVGSKVKIGLRKKGSKKDVELVLAALPGTPGAFERKAAPSPRKELAPLGFSVGAHVTGPTGRGLRVTAVDPASRAYVAGLREGDIVLSVGDTPLKNAKDLESAASASVVRLFIQRGLRPMFLAYRTR